MTSTVGKVWIGGDRIWEGEYIGGDGSSMIRQEALVANLILRRSSAWVIALRLQQGLHRLTVLGENFPITSLRT